MKKLIIAIALVTSTFAGGATAEAATKYPNCKAMNRDYPHGVGLKKGLVNKGGKAVAYTVSPAVYNANKGRDRDHDLIACEK